MVFGKVDEKFNQVAPGFDNIMVRLIPYYEEFLDLLVAVLPYDKTDSFQVIDLGCGTGGIGQRILRHFPKAKLTCVDFSQQMLGIAKQKLTQLFPEATVVYQQEDFNHFIFTQQYDAIVSSLALHHLPTDEKKQTFYEQIWQALPINGMHLNVENVLSPNQALQAMYIQKWHGYMALSYEEDEIQNKWLAGYYDDDRPISLITHFEMMQKAGFSEMDVICKYYNIVLLYGKK